MKVAFTGLESSGKSLQLAVIARRILDRNIQWLKLTGVPRTMAFDSPMSESFVKEIEEAGCIYMQFSNLIDILYLTQADIFINEIIKYFPASGSAPLTNEQMDFLTQGAKSGVFMYCASQDFSQAHKQFRLLVNEVYTITKLLGSRRPIESGPPVKKVWGLCMKRKVDPRSFKGDSVTMESKGTINFSFFFIEKRDTERFDTLYKVPMSELPVKYVRKQKHIWKTPEGEKLIKEVYV